MFRLLFVTISLISLSVAAATPDSLEQINADLLAKKSKEEPFKDKDVKVDLESLGLDDLDARDNKAKSTNNSATSPDKTSTTVEKAATPTVEIKDDKANLASEKAATTIEKSQLLPPETINKESKNSAKAVSIFDKMKELGKKAEKINNKKTTTKQTFIQKDLSKKTPSDNLNKSTDADAIEEEKIIENKPVIVENAEKINATKSDRYVNSTKKANLKKYEEKKKNSKKQAEENEKKIKNNLAKLTNLKKRYLLKLNNDESNQDVEEDLIELDKKIVPKRREINKFVSYENPAPPILNRYRSHDNEGIPIILSEREKADILFRSIGQNDVSYFNSLYKEIENPNLLNDFGDTILTYSILMQKRDIVASILAKGANPDLPNALGYTPLQITIESLDIASFNLLINANADINYVDGYGRTNLMHAARLGFLQAIDTLIKKGADINAMDHDGFTALAIANKYKQELAVALLLKNGAKPWVEKPYDPESESIMNQLKYKWKR